MQEDHVIFSNHYETVINIPTIYQESPKNKTDSILKELEPYSIRQFKINKSKIVEI